MQIDDRGTGMLTRDEMANGLHQVCLAEAHSPMNPPLRSLRATLTAALAALAFVASVGFGSTVALAAPPLAHRELQLPVLAELDLVVHVPAVRP